MKKLWKALVNLEEIGQHQVGRWAYAESREAAKAYCEQFTPSSVIYYAGAYTDKNAERLLSRTASDNRWYSATEREYFCDACGHHFMMRTPVPTFFTCPECGCWSTLPCNSRGSQISIENGERGQALEALED